MSGADLCRKGNQRKPETFSKSYKFPPTYWQLGITKCCPGRKACMFTCQSLRKQPWPAWWTKIGKISFYWLSYKLYMGWCFKSCPPYCTLYTANIQPMSFMYTFILNIILPARQNCHSCLISGVRLEDIGSFLYEKYLLPNSNTWFHMDSWKLQSTTFLCGHMTYWIIIMSKGLYFITQNIKRPQLGYYFYSCSGNNTKGRLLTKDLTISTHKSRN